MTNYEMMTKREKFKQMSLEELARLLDNHGICDCCVYRHSTCGDCLTGYREWLESEVDTE